MIFNLRFSYQLLFFQPSLICVCSFFLILALENQSAPLFVTKLLKLNLINKHVIWVGEKSCKNYKRTCLIMSWLSEVIIVYDETEFGNRMFSQSNIKLDIMNSLVCLPDGSLSNRCLFSVFCGCVGYYVHDKRLCVCVCVLFNIILSNKSSICATGVEFSKSSQNV